MIANYIYQELNGKVVIVWAGNKSFGGKLHYGSGFLIISPVDTYQARHFGPVYVDINGVIAIREDIQSSKDEDEGEADCCEKESPKSVYKKSEKVQEESEDKPRNSEDKYCWDKIK